ncbi:MULTISPECIES: alpha/beta fold hydrolase [Bacillus]|uniref:alpha/beta fold hydrolase n=1 Tax=Bacillus TaxID=1386 RepID=UPI000BB79D57|nr:MULTISPECIES: alpha/beta fold hydrolase [Bacillus]
MIIVNKQFVGEIPLLEVYNESIAEQKAPTIFFIHGITSMKEMNLSYAYLLAEKGFRIFLPDCTYHGERTNRKNEAELGPVFWKIVIQTIHELDFLRKHFLHQGKIDEDRIGVVGTSMGGFITLGALTQFEWIKTAVSLMGCPDYKSFAQMKLSALPENTFSEEEIRTALEQIVPYDLSKQPDKLQNRPLFCWHGKCDKEVPSNYIEEFYEALKDSSSHFELVIDEKAEHKVSKHGMYKTVSWFNEYL